MCHVKHNADFLARNSARKPLTLPVNITHHLVLIRAVKLIHSFSETCFPSNDFTILARGTGSLGPCKEYYLAIISLCHDAQTDSGSVKTR